VIAHLALQKAGLDNLKDPDWDFEEALGSLDAWVPDVTTKMSASFPDNLAFRTSRRGFHDMTP